MAYLGVDLDIARAHLERLKHSDACMYSACLHDESLIYKDYSQLWVLSHAMCDFYACSVLGVLLCMQRFSIKKKRSFQGVG